MKKILVAAALFITLHSFATPTAVSEKVLHAFNQVFKNAEQVRWEEKDGQYEVQFNQDNIKNRVLYDNNGNVLESLRYYSEEQLPLLIRAKVQKQFAGEKVFGVTEHFVNNEVVYHIILENDTQWINIHSSASGEIHIDKKYKKA